MAIKQDVQRDGGRREAPTASADELQVEAGSAIVPDSAADAALAVAGALPTGSQDVALVGAVSPAQLGARRFVYAGYFAAAIGIAFLLSKIVDFAWFKIQSLRPAVGEPRDEIVMPVAAAIGVGVAVYYWYRTRARELAEEVADEMSKVAWPTRTEVTNGTFVVIVTTLVSTAFFALMDRFWSFLTNLVYGGS